MSENSGKVRVRFAPSPTGPLHMGGVRTALFNYLFAKKHGGDFLLRIEDTDQTRYVEGAEEYIINSLNWCGLTPVEGPEQGGPYAPYRQSERKEIYSRYAQQLIENGWAYYAFDTPEELDKLRASFEAEKKTFSYNALERNNLNNSLNLSENETRKRISDGQPYVIRFKMPEDEIIEMTDLIRGHVKFNTSQLDDKVLFKSDGLPTYHLANVVDDYTMKISHVIRGEEWLPSLPLHVMLYRALGWVNQMPLFAHLPLILKPEGKGKLSKRDGDKMGFPVFPLEWNSPEGEVYRGYKEDGYLPQAFINMLALLGWNPGTEEEIFSINDLVQLFSLERVNKAGARFDPEKAKWFNQQHIQKLSSQALAELFAKDLESKGISAENEKLLHIIDLIKDRLILTTGLWEQAWFFFEAPMEYDSKTVKKRWKEDTPGMVERIIELLTAVAGFTSANLEEKVKTFIMENELALGQVMNALRLALVGAPLGPHLFDIMEVIGKDETIRRLQKAIQEINNN